MPPALVLDVPFGIAWGLAALGLTAGIYDLATRRIPNWLTLSGVAAGLSLNVLLFGVAGLSRSMAGLVTAGGLYMVLYLLRAMGAGDVKLMAAVGAFLGPGQWFQIFLISSALGAAAAVILALRKRRLRSILSNVAFIVSELLHLRPPYLGKPELDLRNEKAIALPHGAVIGAAMVALLIAGHFYRPF
jgi:prepilin peptidase CpaA